MARFGRSYPIQRLVTVVVPPVLFGRVFAEGAATNYTPLLTLDGGNVSSSFGSGLMVDGGNAYA